MAYEVIEAIWENDEINWIDRKPSAKKCKMIVLCEEEKDQAVADVDFRMLFEKLADLGTFDHIEDPVAWQREIRKEL